MGRGRPGQQGRRRPRRRVRPPRLRRRPLAADGIRGARQVAAPPRRPDGRARRGTRARRQPRHGQADRPGPCTTSPARRRTSASSPTTRGCPPRDALPMDTGHHSYTRFEPCRRRRRDRAVELPADARDVEDRAGDGLGQHGRAQAGRGHPDVGDASWPGWRSRPAFPRACSTSCTATAPTRSGSALTENPDIDRITFTGESGTGKAIAPGRLRNAHAGQPRTRRQGREPRLRRRRPGQRRLVVDPVDLPQRRAGVPRRQPAVRRAGHLRRVPVALRRRRPRR